MNHDQQLCIITTYKADNLSSRWPCWHLSFLYIYFLPAFHFLFNPRISDSLVVVIAFSCINKKCQNIKLRVLQLRQKNIECNILYRLYKQNLPRQVHKRHINLLWFYRFDIMDHITLKLAIYSIIYNNNSIISQL